MPRKVRHAGTHVDGVKSLTPPQKIIFDELSLMAEEIMDGGKGSQLLTHHQLHTAVVCTPCCSNGTYVLLSYSQGPVPGWSHYERSHSCPPGQEVIHHSRAIVIFSSSLHWYVQRRFESYRSLCDVGRGHANRFKRVHKAAHNRASVRWDSSFHVHFLCRFHFVPSLCDCRWIVSQHTVCTRTRFYRRATCKPWM